MYQIGQTPLAKLRPDRLDDVALQKQISLIQEACGDIDPDSIALVFHECDYNIQSTIARIKSGNIEDGGWQKAKSNHKKKNHNTNTSDQLSNSGMQSDSERSLSQHTSPTPSLRGGNNRQSSSSRSNVHRRGNDAQHKPIEIRDRIENIKSTEVTPSSKVDEETTPTISSAVDGYQFIGHSSQSLTFDHGQKKSTPSSLIPQKPVSMHPTVRFSTKPIDIQFGDVQWNDSVPIAITPSNSPILAKSLDEQTLETNFSAQDDLSTNIPDRELHETTNVLSSTSFEITNNSSEEISHLSDRINEPSQQITSPSTSHQFLPNTNSSAFSPYATPTANYQSLPRDYPSTWNMQQSPNYKPNPKTTMLPTGTYPPSTYSLPPQQQYYVSSVPYHAPAYYSVMTSADPWSNIGYESYPTFATTNYLQTYPNQQQYYQTARQDSYGYDKDFYTHYGQTRLNNNTSELPNATQSTKETPVSSKLSATAASFSQATNSTGTLFMNPSHYTLPTYYPSQQDRTMTYTSGDNRDYRNGASYGGNNRSNYYQQQRSHQNSTWH